MITFHLLLLLLATVFTNQVKGDFGLKDLYDVYTNCTENTMEDCLSVELVSGLEELQHQEKIPMIAGLELVRNTTKDNSSVNQEILNEDKVEESRGHKKSLDEIILEKMHNILNTHSFRFTSEEERGKSSKIGKVLLPFLLGVMMKLATFLPMVLSVLKALAFKALIASKTALVLSLILGVKKLVESQREQQTSYKPKVHHIYSSPAAASYGDFAASSEILRLGAGHNNEEQQLSDSRTEYSHFTPGVYGRSLQNNESNSKSKVRRRSIGINSLHDIIHKTRTVLA